MLKEFRVTEPLGTSSNLNRVLYKRTRMGTALLNRILAKHFKIKGRFRCTGSQMLHILFSKALRDREVTAFLTTHSRFYDSG